ncbi:MAG: DUF202 domain-containing protein [Scandinavium sp.]|uniref:DUF202 domain-containing protein n=1 Tax=Scandinavium sp. TaxID=2830653 RepID=UPI003F305117
MQRDRGLQPERTYLSWHRTGWSMLVPGLLCLRGWSHSGEILYAVAGGLLLCGSLTLFCGAGYQRHQFISLLIVISSLLLIMAPMTA